MIETDDDYVNRQRTANDEKLWTLELAQLSLIPPIVGIFDAPTRCYIINKEWAKIVMGAVSAQLLSIASWRDATDESYSGIQAIEEFLRGGDCGGDCTIEELLADDVFFETEYIPATFGEYYSETVANETALAAAYDGTPQSIGADIPTGTPDGAEKNALCAAVNRFVALYASTKLCLIQSKNFAEILWTKLAGAANDMYDLAATLMSPIYSPNIFSCFISDSAAIVALQNVAAIEELACHIYDELKTVTMSQANFDAALSDAAMTLTGDSGAIACLMVNDNSQSVYINMLEAYQVALQDSNANCPCESSSYWRLYMDFRTGNRYGTTTVHWNGSPNDGSWQGDGYYYNTPSTAVSTLNVAIGLANLGSDYVIRGFASVSDRAGSNNDNGQDFAESTFYAGEALTGAVNAIFSQGAIPDGDDLIYGGLQPFAYLPCTSFWLRSRVMQATDDSPHVLRVHQIVFWGLAHLTTGEKPPLAQWAGNTLPTTLEDLFP